MKIKSCRFFLPAFLFLIPAAQAQEPQADVQTRGAKPQAVPVLTMGETYAIVVGISNYQDTGITDLKYAHRDAEAFVSYLRSAAGGAIPAQNIKLLLNEQATLAGLASAWDELTEEGKILPGDRIIFYFSGHGDVETRLSSKPGYLLCHNAPARVYTAGGTFDVRVLQDYVTTLSQDKQAKVVLLIDACHSGKLAGSAIGGTAITGAGLAKQYAYEIKLLSCQPNEVSLESNKWGGGRGLFSMHLVDGMYGLADANNDRVVTLREIETYLNTQVTKDSEDNQNPKIIGDPKEKVGLVDSAMLATLLSGKQKGKDALPVFAAKGFSIADSLPRARYEAFNKALAERRFFAPQGDCAEDLYKLLLADKELAALHNVMTRNYATALQDDVQNAINDYLVSDPVELRKRWSYDPRYEEYPRYLARAAELLGEKHVFYADLKNREYYFTGLNLRLKGEREKNETLYPKAVEWQQKALTLDPSAAYAHNELGLLSRRMGRHEQSLGHFRKAIEYAPEWVLPWANLCGSYTDLDRYPEAVEAGEKAVALNNRFVLALYNLGVAYQFSGEEEKARIQYLRVLEIDTLYAQVYYQLGEIEFRNEQFGQADQFWRAYVAQQPNDPDGLFNMGAVCGKLEKPEEALVWYQKTLKADPDYHKALLRIGWNYLDLGKPAEAKTTFNQYLAKKTANPGADVYYGLASVECMQQNLDPALDYLELAFKNGFDNLPYLNGDVRMEPIRKHPRYDQLLEQYFKAEK